MSPEHESETRSSATDRAAALERLPHGEGFRFVDELAELDPGKSATGRYLLRGDEDFLRGHFPGQPMMPGVLFAEAIAQVAGVAAQCEPEITPLDDLRLTGLRSVKILGAAFPGEVLEISATVEGRLGKLIQARGSVQVDGREIATAVVTLSGN